MKYHDEAAKILAKLGYHDITIKRDERIWTRGDGARYKELDTVHVKGFRGIEVFERLLATSGRRPIMAKGTFGSSKLRRAFKMRNVVFLEGHGPNYFEVASPSVLRNEVYFP